MPSFTSPSSTPATRLSVEPFQKVGEPVGRIVAGLSLKKAARALVNRDCRYDGPNIVIPCADHAEAMRLVRELRAALERAA